jgi:hypothetical protein
VKTTNTAMLVSKGTTEDDAINIANDGTAGLPLVAARDEDDTQHLLEFKETAAEVKLDGIIVRTNRVTHQRLLCHSAAAATMNRCT